MYTYRVILLLSTRLNDQATLSLEHNFQNSTHESHTHSHTVQTKCGIKEKVFTRQVQEASGRVMQKKEEEGARKKEEMKEREKSLMCVDLVRSDGGSGEGEEEKG